MFDYYDNDVQYEEEYDDDEYDSKDIWYSKYCYPVIEHF